MTSKQRAYLKRLAMTMEPILQVGKSSMTPELPQLLQEALEARELIKISVLQNCMDDPREIAEVLAERTRFPGRTGDRQERSFCTKKEKKRRKKFSFRNSEEIMKKRIGIMGEPLIRFI